MDILKTLIKDYWPLLAAIGAGILFLIKKCTWIIKRVNKIDKIEDELESMKKDTGFIKGKVSLIEKMMRGVLSASAIPSTPGLLQSHSPIQLTDKGKDILNECGFKNIYNDNKERFLELTKKQQPKQKYDAQEVALSVLIGLIDDPILEPLRKYTFLKGFNIFDVLRVSSIYLRDRIIKELNITE
jgi:hypothetical protein